MRHFISKIIAEYNFFFRKTLPRPSTNVAKQLFKDKPLRVLEIGTYEARNTVSIFKELNVQRIFCVDPYKYYDDNQLNVVQLHKAKALAKERLKLYASKVTWIPTTSSIAAASIKDNSLDFIYIDGDHRYKYVKSDIELYWKKLKKGGIISGHDIDHPGVMQAVGEFTLKNNIEPYLRYPDWVIIKI